MSKYDQMIHYHRHHHYSYFPSHFSSSCSMTLQVMASPLSGFRDFEFSRRQELQPHVHPPIWSVRISIFVRYRAQNQLWVAIPAAGCRSHSHFGYTIHVNYAHLK